MILSQINIFPVKGLAGFSPDSANVLERGLEFDRRFLLVDDKNNFITQRENSRLAALRAHVDNDTLVFTSSLDDDRSPLYSLDWPDDQTPENDSPRLSVRVWSSSVNARHLDDHHDTFFSNYLRQPCKLVFMDLRSRRISNPRVTKTPVEVSFADGYPYLILSEASVQDLNNRLKTPVEMIRFRPNLVLADANPFAEDELREISVGECRFRVVSKCVRCQVITVNLQTFEFEKEPLKTLSTYRRHNNNVQYGVNAIALKHGVVKVGDEVIPV